MGAWLEDVAAGYDESASGCGVLDCVADFGAGLLRRAFDRR